MTSSPLPCIVCGAALQPAFSDGDAVPAIPAGGVQFRAYGNYGSQVYDPNGLAEAREYLTINVCDGCLIAKAAAAHVLRVRFTPQPDLIAAGRFDPDAENRAFAELAAAQAAAKSRTNPDVESPS